MTNPSYNSCLLKHGSRNLGMRLDNPNSELVNMSDRPTFRVRGSTGDRGAGSRRERAAGTHIVRPSPSCRAFVTRAKFGELSKLLLFPSFLLRSFVRSFLLRFAIFFRSKPQTLDGPIHVCLVGRRQSLRGTGSLYG